MTIFIVYELKKGSTLMTEKNLKVMQKVEKYLTTFDKSKYSEYCLAESQLDLSCA